MRSAGRRSQRPRILVRARRGPQTPRELSPLCQWAVPPPRDSLSTRPKAVFKVYAHLRINTKTSPAAALIRKALCRTISNARTRDPALSQISRRSGSQHSSSSVVGVELLSSSMPASSGWKKRGNIKVAAEAGLRVYLLIVRRDKRRICLMAAPKHLGKSTK